MRYGHVQYKSGTMSMSGRSSGRDSEHMSDFKLICLEPSPGASPAGWLLAWHHTRGTTVKTTRSSGSASRSAGMLT